MTAKSHLAKAITDFELIHQRNPTKLILDWQTRAELAREDALPDMMIVNSVAPERLLRLE